VGGDSIFRLFYLTLIMQIYANDANKLIQTAIGDQAIGEPGRWLLIADLPYSHSRSLTVLFVRVNVLIYYYSITI